MSSTARAWIAAVSVGAVQGLRDQGLIRWNHTLKSIHQYYAKKTFVGAPFSQSKLLSSSVLYRISNNTEDQEQHLKVSEESLRKVMYLSCWGPN